MEVGAAISVDHDIDTTTEGPFSPAQYFMQGGISRLLMALFLIIAVSRPIDPISGLQTGHEARWSDGTAAVLTASNSRPGRRLPGASVGSGRRPSAALTPQPEEHPAVPL